MGKSFHYCPNCSSQDITFDFRKFQCNVCEMVYYQNVAAATAVILRKNDEILFTVRNREPEFGKLDLPGGFTDPDETAEQTCQRELKEELGIEIPLANFKYLLSQPNNYEYKTIPYKTCDLVFEATFPTDVNIEIEEDEIQEIKWIKISDIDLNEIGFVSLRKAVKHYIENI